MDDFWFGMGFFCCDVKFHVSVQKSATARVGFRVNRFIRIPSLIKQHQKNSENMFFPILPILEEFDLPQEIVGITCPGIYRRAEDIKKVMTFIDHLGLDKYLSDIEGYEKMKWILDNPMPSNFDEFIVWAEAFENETRAHTNKGTIGDY
tara:strand:+ start:2293 stop:2739 length:447 start_codon:yes stop_codon:yes gene_type:complete